MSFTFICTTTGIRFKNGDTVFIDDPMSPVIPEKLAVKVKRTLGMIELIDDQGVVHTNAPLKIGGYADVDLVTPSSCQSTGV